MTRTIEGEEEHMRERDACFFLYSQVKFFEKRSSWKEDGDEELSQVSQTSSCLHLEVQESLSMIRTYCQGSKGGVCNSVNLMKT